MPPFPVCDTCRSGQPDGNQVRAASWTPPAPGPASPPGQVRPLRRGREGAEKVADHEIAAEVREPDLEIGAEAAVHVALDNRVVVRVLVAQLAHAAELVLVDELEVLIAAAGQVGVDRIEVDPVTHGIG